MLPLLNGVLRAILPRPADFFADVVTDLVEHLPDVLRSSHDAYQLEAEIYDLCREVFDDLPYVDAEDAADLATGATALALVIRQACADVKPKPWRKRPVFATLRAAKKGKPA